MDPRIHAITHLDCVSGKLCCAATAVTLEARRGKVLALKHDNTWLGQTSGQSSELLTVPLLDDDPLDLRKMYPSVMPSVSTVFDWLVLFTQ